MSRRRADNLPANVHAVRSGARVYYYWQEGRGTKQPGPRERLPDDPDSPEFRAEIRKRQGAAGHEAPGTFGAMVDAFLDFHRTSGRITAGTLDQYRRALRRAKDGWGAFPARGLRPFHVQQAMDGMSGTPGRANNFLAAMRAMSSWGRARDWTDWSITEGVSPYPKDGGHRPWTPAQIEAALAGLTGMVRRGVVLYLNTGMRGSDAVCMGWTDIEDGGFAYKARKTRRDVFCPILPELREEMATWQKRPGPLLYQEDGRAKGRPYTRKLFSKHFAAQRDRIPELAGATLHGLRCTAVVRLKRAGLEVAQIGDIVGMSMPMIQRYCRFEDVKQSSLAAVVVLERVAADRKKNGGAA